MRLLNRLTCHAVGHEPRYFQVRTMIRPAGAGTNTRAAHVAILLIPSRFKRRDIWTLSRGLCSALKP